MERRLASYLYVFPLIAMGIWSRIRHPGETAEEYVMRTYPGTTSHRYDDYLD